MLKRPASLSSTSKLGVPAPRLLNRYSALLLDFVATSLCTVYLQQDIKYADLRQREANEMAYCVLGGSNLSLPATRLAIRRASVIAHHTPPNCFTSSSLRGGDDLIDVRCCSPGRENGTFTAKPLLETLKGSAVWTSRVAARTCGPSYGWEKRMKALCFIFEARVLVVMMQE